MVLVIFHSSHIKHEQSVSLQNIQLLLNYMPIVKKKKENWKIHRHGATEGEITPLGNH